MFIYSETPLDKSSIYIYIVPLAFGAQMPLSLDLEKLGRNFSGGHLFGVIYSTLFSTALEYISGKCLVQLDTILNTFIKVKWIDINWIELRTN